MKVAPWHADWSIVAESTMFSCTVAFAHAALDDEFESRTTFPVITVPSPNVVGFQAIVERVNHPLLELGFENVMVDVPPVVSAVWHAPVDETFTTRFARLSVVV